MRRQLRTILLGVVATFAAWIGAAEALTFVQPPGRPVAVIARGGLDAALAAVLAADGYVLQVKGDTVIAISEQPGFVPRLYDAGALFVILATTGGCIVAGPDA